jgi:hypothetical protein
MRVTDDEPDLPTARQFFWWLFWLEIIQEVIPDSDDLLQFFKNRFGELHFSSS